MNTATNQSHSSYRITNVGNNNMYMLKLPILCNTGEQGLHFIKDTITINLDHLVYAYPTEVKVHKIKKREDKEWTSVNEWYKVNNLMLTRFVNGGSLMTTVDIHNTIDWILHSGPGFYDLTK